MGGGYLEGGWKRERYIVQKANGKPLDPRAKYFVLRYDAPGGDPNARAAMRAYAVNVSCVNPRLAKDILVRVAREEKKACPRCQGMGRTNRFDDGTLIVMGTLPCPACGGSGARKLKSTGKEKK